jgi:hypothetical protein
MKQRYFKVDGSMEKKWDTVISADLKRLFISVLKTSWDNIHILGNLKNRAKNTEETQAFNVSNRTTLWGYQTGSTEVI